MPPCQINLTLLNTARDVTADVKWQTERDGRVDLSLDHIMSACDELAVRTSSLFAIAAQSALSDSFLRKGRYTLAVRVRTASDTSVYRA